MLYINLEFLDIGNNGPIALEIDWIGLYSAVDSYRYDDVILAMFANRNVTKVLIVK